MADKKTPFLIRQGDVLLELVDALPADAVPQPLDDERGLVLAEGEVTGHAHRIPHRYASGAAGVYRTEMDARFMRASAPVPLRHEEHKTQCAVCARAGKVTIATARIVSDFTAAGYLCQEHAAAIDSDQAAVQQRRTVHHHRYWLRRLRHQAGAISVRTRPRDSDRAHVPIR